MTLTGTVLGAIWANLRWGRFWSWDVKEIGALLTVIWQAILLALLRSRPAKIRWLLCWGMLGNVVVTFAWGYPRNMIAIVLAILITHALLMTAALAPSGWLRIRKTTG
jgi:ABC-type transport system involved in cytochrome c biogenesis permease subunit